MKAIVLTEYGGIDKLEIQEHRDPEPGAGELQVRVVSASINPIDWKLRSGAAKARMPLDLPAILGRDAAGTVTRLGSGVSGFKLGDKVMGLVMGAYAELVVAPEGTWAKVPEGLELADAGVVPLAGLTGDQLVAAALGEAPPGKQTVLVTGALGSVGRSAVWAAKSRGARVIAGVRGKDLEEGRELGADGVLALDDAAAVSGLPPVDAIADTVGGETLQKLLSRVKPGGVVASVLGEPPGAKEQGLQPRPIMTKPDGKRLAEIAFAFAKRQFSIPVAKRFPLAEARAAQRLAEGGAGGKVVLEP